MDQATTIQHQGRSGQRLVVTFQHHGRTTINTAVVPLVSKEAADQMRSSSTATAPGKGWLAELEQKNGGTGSELTRLPESMTDPFASLPRRVERTLDSYRYNTDPRSLLDWAIAMTGLDDPLSRYTRHELEDAFPWFARNRDRHLVDLVRQLKSQGKTAQLTRIAGDARHPAAREAIKKAMR